MAGEAVRFVKWAGNIGYGGVSEELIASVHEEIQQYRARKGLAPYDFGAVLGNQARGREAGTQEGDSSLRADTAEQSERPKGLSAGAGR